MCRPASFIVTKKQVFWSKTDESHEIIIEENNLQEMDVRNNPTFVRVEIVPPNEDYTLPFKKWEYCLDQDIKPVWYSAKDVEKRCRAHLKEWRKCKVVMPNEEREKIDGSIIAIYGTVESIRGGTVESIRGGTVKYIRGGTVEYIRGGTVEYIGGGTVKSIDGGTVKSIDGGTVEYIGGGTVEYIRGGTVESIRGGTVKYIRGGTVKSIDGGTVKSIDGGTVEYIGGGTVEYIRGGTVEYIGGKFPKKITGSPTIISYGSLSPDILKSSQAVLIDRSGHKVKCFIGK